MKYAFLRRVLVLCLTLMALAIGPGEAAAAPTPEAWWQMNKDTGTTAVDSSGNGYNGTIVGGEWVEDPTDDDFGTVLLFDWDKSSRVEIGKLFQFGSKFTVTFWARIHEAMIDYNIFLSKGKKEEGHFEIYAESGHPIVSIYAFELSDTTEPFWRLDSKFAMNDLQWHHIAVAYDGTKPSGNMIWYIDGVKTSTLNVSGTILETSAPLIIGRLSGATDEEYSFNGYMTDMRIYKAMLTAAEVTAVYNNRAVPGATSTPGPTSGATATPSPTTKPNPSTTSQPTATPTAPVTPDATATEGATPEPTAEGSPSIEPTTDPTPESTASPAPSGIVSPTEGAEGGIGTGAIAAIVVAGVLILGALAFFLIRKRR